VKQENSVSDSLDSLNKFDSKLFGGFSTLAMFFLLPYAYFQLQAGLTQLAVLYVLSAVAIFGLRIYSRGQGKMLRAKRLFAGIGPVVLLPWLITGGIGGTGHFWFFAYIVFIFAFLDFVSAMFWFVFIYVAAASLVVLDKTGLVNIYYSDTTLFHFFYTSVVMALLMIVYVRLRDIVRKEMLALASTYEEAQLIAGIGNWKWDIKNDAIYWSSQMKRMFGIDNKEKLTLQNYLNLVHSEDIETVRSAVNNSLETGEAFEIVHRVKRPDGSIIWISGKGHVVFGKDRKPSYMAGTAQDITQQKQTQEQILRQNTQLGRLEKITIGRELKMIELKKKAKARDDN
jgi:PAS domain S-box-containing protein